ncbi:MAG: ATP-binding cassette domain-containing protein [Propionibacteriaceae bacterium]|jgi:ABC-2 type transport system ATP-binding protein|nr:ATP-binding cassette domain-containing protein [Propionibacteriaceae bacterium]
MAIAVSVRHVTKIIRGAVVLDDVSLELAAGRVYGLRGANGSGKTMLMRALCGLIRPTKGEVTVDGRRVGSSVAFPDGVGALIEHPAFLAKLTGFKNLALLGRIRGVVTAGDVRQALRDVGLEPADRRPFRKFSLGMKQRLGIAAALMEHPGLIVLDEPANGLDVDSMRLLRRLLAQRRDEGALVVLSSHDQAELDFLADEVFEFSAGKVTGSRGSPRGADGGPLGVGSERSLYQSPEGGPVPPAAAPRRSAGKARRGWL